MAIKIGPIQETEKSQLISLWEACDLTRPWNNPDKDITVALKAQETEIFVARHEVQEGKAAELDTIVGSVMVGFDGHRGWIYYLSVKSDFQNKGIGRQLIQHAEHFLKGKNCPKVMLMVRPENQKVKKIYEKQGYEEENRALLVKWLSDSPQKPDTRLPVVISYLEMNKAPAGAYRHPPQLDKPLSVIKLQDCTVSYYRYLYNTIGENFLWWEKRVASDAEIEAIVTRGTTDLYILSVGGVPAGWCQIDDLGKDENGQQTAEIGYFGLFPEFIGKGLGGYWLDFAIRTAWELKSAPKRVIVNTCTLDHPIALPTYQKSGFSPYKQERILIEDPRLSGVIPAHIALVQPAPFSPTELHETE